ncbi:hypothetical protein HPP92_014731, partial [Vanilla planifolia]
VENDERRLCVSCGKLISNGGGRKEVGSRDEEKRGTGTKKKKAEDEEDEDGLIR